MHAWAVLSDIDLDFVRSKQYPYFGINHHEVIKEITVPSFASGLIRFHRWIDSICGCLGKLERG